MNHLLDTPSNALTGGCIGLALGLIAQRLGADCDLRQCIYFGAQVSTALAGLRLGLHHPERAYEISMAAAASSGALYAAGFVVLGRDALALPGADRFIHLPRPVTFSVPDLFASMPVSTRNATWVDR